MKKKVLSLLAAATLCMGLMVVPFNASAADTISGSIDGYSCIGKTWYGAAPGQGVSTTSFGKNAQYIWAFVLYRYGYGGSVNQTYTQNDDTNTNYIMASTNISGYPVGRGTRGRHEIKSGAYTWHPEDTTYGSDVPS